MALREVRKIFEAQPTIEGAGVHLKRGFGGRSLELFDPFLLFDDFSSPLESDYLRGFPWHPHRGIETVTYLLEGDVEHQDSIGNTGTIRAGDVQWMSAGSGIIHQEMPQPAPGGIRGFQLWVNLPKAEKMSAPKYRDIGASTIPETGMPGVRVKVIAGAYEKEMGPAAGIAGGPTYLDVILEKGATLEYPIASGDTTLLYIVEGRVAIGTARTEVGAESVVVTDQAGDLLHIAATETDARFLVMIGTPLNEPVAWHGPIVMNTQEEILQALSELRTDTFIK